MAETKAKAKVLSDPGAGERYRWAKAGLKWTMAGEMAKLLKLSNTTAHTPPERHTLGAHFTRLFSKS